MYDVTTRNTHNPAVIGWAGGAARASAFYNPKISTRTSETPLFADSTWHEASPFSNGVTIDAAPGNGYSTTQQIADTYVTGNGVGSMMAGFYLPRHGKALTSAYVDGHAEKLPLTDIFKQIWHRGYVPPTSAVYYTGR